MLLAIDAGNTNIVLAVYDGQTQVKQWRRETDADMATMFEAIPDDIDAVIVSSVVPALNDTIRLLCEKNFNLRPDFIDYTNAGIEIMLPQPEEIGADRLVDAVAVLAHYQAPAIIVDFGTATTFDVIDAQRRYCGGAIAPGINLSLHALHMAAAKLPDIAVAKPAHVIGGNTKEAMQSGIYWGYVSLIEGMLMRLEEAMQLAPGEKPLIIATGGLAPLFATGTDKFDVIDPDLIMKGLVHIHTRLSKADKRKTA